MSMPTLTGLHHVTAITADGQANIDFYAGVLGLRLVKVTVNFDDPRCYHLYYGNEHGDPGTGMTFFAWPGARQGRVGAPQVTATAFAAPSGSLPFWRDRLALFNVDLARESERFGERVIEFADGDGTRLEIVGTERATLQPWADGPVPADDALRGFHSVTLSEEGYERTARLLTDTLRLREGATDGNRNRFLFADDATGSVLDVLCVPAGPRGRLGAGIVHHVALSTPREEDQSAWREAFAGAMLNVSPVMNRKYFHSIYCREPGGVLLEIATQGPGFTVDEQAAALGTTLKLPAVYEADRAKIESALPRLRLPGGELLP